MGKVLPAAAPQHPTFDPYNTSSSGHQIHASHLAGTPSWRESRTLKLSAQLSAGEGGGGGKRLYDTVGAGSREFGLDGRKENGTWDVKSIRGARAESGIGGERWGDVGVMLGGGVRKKDGLGTAIEVGKRRVRKEETEEIYAKRHKMGSYNEHYGGNVIKVPGDYEIALKQHIAPTASPFETIPEEAICTHGPPVVNPSTALSTSSTLPSAFLVSASNPSTKKGMTGSKRPIFASLTIYINGSTAPLISDHKLKYLLVEHGANISIALGRRTVTHVILGRPNAKNSRDKGAGGGLAASKIQKEIRRVGGKGVKFVNVDWVLESIKVGKRLPEAGFVGCEAARPAGVKSVYGIFKREGGRGGEKRV
ncbi:hypothetical protein MMC19_000072 [Ptychographa xylographoides]|nr:hypothetical protein [Ptychographa xylographoides]